MRILQPGPAAHPASCTTGPGVFPGSKVARGLALTAQLHLAQRLSKEWRSTSTSPLRPHDLFYGECLHQYQNKTQPSSQILLQPQNVKKCYTPLSKILYLMLTGQFHAAVLHKELIVSQLVNSPILKRPKVHYRLHNSAPPEPHQSHIHPVQSLQTHFSKILFNTVLSQLTFSVQVDRSKHSTHFLCRLTSQNTVHISYAG